MLETVLLGCLFVLFVMGSIASVGWDVLELRNREVWWWTGIMLLETALMPSWGSMLLMASITLGLFQVGRLWYVLRSTLIPIAGVAGAYALIAPHMQLWMIPWLLWTGTGIGLYLALYAALGLWFPQRPFRLIAPKSWFGLWAIYEDLDGPARHLCGQANQNHLCSLSALAMACAAGLVWMGQWWAVPALLLCYLPLHVVWRSSPQHPHMGHFAMIALLIGALAFWSLWAAAAVLGLCILTALVLIWHSEFWVTPQGWIDSGRLAYWLDVLFIVWWPRGWRKRLFGFGTCTWFLTTCRTGEKNHPALFTAAHNEYLQQLVEHGIVGLLLLLAYLGEALWRNLSGLPAQQAVFLIGLTWCAIALVNFPATFYHEYHPTNDEREHYYGSPPLNVWTFMLALLAEAK